MGRPKKLDGLQMPVGTRCWYCGRLLVDFVPGDYVKLRMIRSKDHLIPQSRGGSDEPDNLVWACKSCNSQKATKTVEEYRAYLRRKNSLVLIRFHGERYPDLHDSGEPVASWAEQQAALRIIKDLAKVKTIQPIWAGGR